MNDLTASASGDSAATVELLDATLDHKPVLRRLLELYLHDMSRFDGAEVDARGCFGYAYLDRYWTDLDRHPFLLRVNDRWAGFALVRTGEPNDVAEFFVLRRHRRLGIGAAAAHALFARFPGRWQVRQMAANVGAIAFWRRVAPADHAETRWAEGPALTFTV